MFRVLTLFLIFAVSRVFAGPLDDAYQEGKNAAQANIHKSVDGIKKENFNPTDKFENYNENPPQTSFYHGITSDSGKDLRDAGDAAYTYHEDDTKNNATQAVLKSFKKNPKLKIDPNDPNNPWMSRSKDIMENAPDIAIGASSKPNEVVKSGVSAGINCKESKICRIEYLKKTCNEAVVIQRICEKVPSITTYVKETVYPNCQSLVITQHVNTHCPSGYGEVFGTDMVHTEDNHWDDIRFCTKSTNDGLECYSGGYYIERAVAGPMDAGKVIVPKKLHARIRITNVYFNPVKVTVTNDITGATICNNSDYSSGGVIDLPYSDTQEQTFKFYATQRSCKGWFCRRDTGVLVLYIDRIAKERVANDPVWQESCRNV